MRYIKTYEETKIGYDINDELMDAIQFDYSTDKAKDLIAKGADINYKDSNNDNMTPILIAVAYDRQDILKYLIDNGANINSQDTNGRTPLMMAGSMNSLDMIQLLIEDDARWDIKDNNGHNFLMYLTSEIKEMVIEDYPEKYHALKYNL